MKTKPFKLEDTSFATQYVTRNGFPVKILTFKAKCAHPIVGLVRIKDFDLVESWSKDGKICSSWENDYDLFILDE